MSDPVGSGGGTATRTVHRAGPPGPGWARDAAVVAGAVLPRPALWGAAFGALRRMARRGWWRRAPFVPLPGEAYWRFRLVTAYGGQGDPERLTASDVVTFLRWCQRSRPGRG